MLENIFGTSTRRVNVDQMEPIELEEGYDGPHLSFPLQPDQVRGQKREREETIDLGVGPFSFILPPLSFPLRSL